MFLGGDGVAQGEPLLCFSSSRFQTKPWSSHRGSLLVPTLPAVSPQAPHFPPGSELLLKAASVYHSFLTWPVPYCDTFRELLTFISNELKAPGERCCPAPSVPAPNPALDSVKDKLSPALAPNPALDSARDKPSPELCQHQTRLCHHQTHPWTLLKPNPALPWHQTHPCQQQIRLCQRQTQPQAVPAPNSALPAPNPAPSSASSNPGPAPGFVPCCPWLVPPFLPASPSAVSIPKLIFSRVSTLPSRVVQHRVPVEEQGTGVGLVCPSCARSIPGCPSCDQRQSAPRGTISWLGFSPEGLFLQQNTCSCSPQAALCVWGQQWGPSGASGWLEPPSLLFHGGFHRAEGLPGLFFPAQPLLVTQLWAQARAAPGLLLIRGSLCVSCGSQWSSSSNYFSKPFFPPNLPAFGGLLKSCYHTEHIAARV